MNEQNPIKNSLEEMKKDLKSLLGIKRNKDSTSVSEKNSSSDIKKEIKLKEEESNKLIENNKIERQIISNKRNDNIIDLTLDENTQVNLNNSLENDLNQNVDEKDLTQNLKDDNINFINQGDKVIKQDFNEEKVQEQINSQAENPVLNTSNFAEIKNAIDSEKRASSELLQKETAQENVEIKDKKELNNRVDIDINEISSNNDNKLNLLDNCAVNLNKDKEKIISESLLVTEQRVEIPKQANETIEKEDIKLNNPSKPIGFNIFNIENLSLPNKDKINEIFKAPQKNFFENLNMKTITFSGTKPSNEEEKKEVLLEENKISKKDENQHKENVIQNELSNLENVGKKVESPKDKAKSITDEPIKAPIKGFSLDMVFGLENQKDEIIKMFTKQEDSKNPFGLGSSSTNTNLFIANNQFKTNITSSENKPTQEISESTKLINHKIEPIVNATTNSKTNEKIEEPKIQEINPNGNQATNQSENFHPIVPNLNGIPVITQISNKIEENINKVLPCNPNIIPMDVEKDFENINANKVNAPIEKKIILSSKIDQIINKKLEKTVINNEAENTAEKTVTQKKTENVIENINNEENKKSIDIQNEIKKEPISLTSNNNVDTGNIINLTNNLENTTDVNNNKPKVESTENREQQVNQIEKKTSVEEKTIPQPVPINLIKENKNESDNKRELDRNQIEKNISENKEVKAQLILRQNIPEKPLESKPNEIDKKESTISVTSILKDTINQEIEPNKAENQMASGQNAPKQAAAPEPAKKRAITFQEAKEQIDKFSDLITNLENEMRDKYGISIPQFYYEELLPEPVKIKLVEEFFNDKEIIDLNKQLQQKLEEKK